MSMVLVDKFWDARWLRDDLRRRFAEQDSNLGRPDVKSSGFVDIVRIYETDGMRRTSDRVTRWQIAYVFAGVTRAGAASERPYGEKLDHGGGH